MMPRPSVIKTISIDVNKRVLTIDIVKTNHVIDRQLTREFDIDMLVKIVEKALSKVIDRFAESISGIQGVIQACDDNIMFGLHYNQYTQHIDFEIVSYMNKRNFITNNIKNAIVIKI